MDLNLLKEWGKENDRIKRLTSDLHFLVEETCEHSSCSLNELKKIHKKMGMVLKQGMFWFEQKNPKRFIYDLEDFVFYLVDFLEKKDKETS
jgi:hypothetical protein